jgi:hypothetical protein
MPSLPLLRRGCRDDGGRVQEVSSGAAVVAALEPRLVLAPSHHGPGGLVRGVHPGGDPVIGLVVAVVLTLVLGTAVEAESRRHAVSRELGRLAREESGAGAGPYR